MKKFLKICLIVFICLVVVGWAWVALTWFSVIPNWFGVGFLNHWLQTISLSENSLKFDWRDPECSSKCNAECKAYEDEPFWYLCWNDCISVCSLPKWEDCTSKCGADIWEDLELLYNYSNYKEWCINFVWSWWKLDCIWHDFKPLYEEKYYNEWVREKFDWYQDILFEYDKCKVACWDDPRMNYLMKPMIYLYPTEEKNIHVTLWMPENLSHTYPKYDILKWRNVLAQPDWKLINLENWRELYALYWEWLSNKKIDFSEWFVVAWKDIISFLEENLAILWLNEREAEEFIVYWLPQMEDNEWNLIRFETKEEQDIIMPLNIEPKPDTVIRVMMDWKAIEQPIEIVEQKLYTPERTGFVVVEWGWTEIE